MVISEPTDDRALQWLKAFGAAGVELVRFDCAPGGFLEQAVWIESVQVQNHRSLRRTALVRISSQSRRRGLSAFQQVGFTAVEECEILTVQVRLPEVVPMAKVPWVMYPGGFVDVIKLANAKGPRDERWIAMYAGDQLSLIDQPPRTWDLGGTFAPAAAPMQQQIAQLVHVYANAARFFASQPAVSTRIHGPDPALHDLTDLFDEETMDDCIAWSRSDLRSTLDMDSNQ